VSIGSILLVLSLSANTAFADFPRLCRRFHRTIICRTDSRNRAEAGVHAGIVVLAILAEYFWFSFWRSNGQIDSLYAVERFWRSRFRSRDGAALVESAGPHWIKFALVNGFGAFVTGVTVVVCW